MQTTQPEQVLTEISKDKERIEKYRAYWESITPANNEEVFWRYVFSFLSVHTAWSTNVRAYNLLRANRDVWFNDPIKLAELIKTSGVGLDIQRNKGILKFKDQFFQNPDFFKVRIDENWQQGRNRIMQECVGLGLAKTAFALEMCFPLQSQTVCLDTHMLQLYGYSPKEVHKGGSNKTRYMLMEKHWIDTCNEMGVPAYIARCLFWDMKQKQTDSRYWSYVLEK